MNFTFFRGGGGCKKGNRIRFPQFLCSIRSNYPHFKFRKIHTKFELEVFDLVLSFAYLTDIASVQ